MRSQSRPCRCAVVAGVIAAAIAGCARTQTITFDLTAEPARFIVNHQGWPRPFRTPRVTEFAIAREDDEAVMWHLRSSDPAGEPASDLAFVFGEVPVRFYQVHPVGDEKPHPLEPGVNYLVAAGAENSDYIYRVVFGLPVSATMPARFAPTGP